MPGRQLLIPFSSRKKGSEKSWVEEQLIIAREEKRQDELDDRMSGDGAGFSLLETFLIVAC